MLQLVISNKVLNVLMAYARQSHQWIKKNPVISTGPFKIALSRSRLIPRYSITPFWKRNYY